MRKLTPDHRMQTDRTETSLIPQIEEFLTYTADTDPDTIIAQYTLVEGLIDQLVTDGTLELDSPKEDNRANYEYFLKVNTANPQSIERKGFALEGLQERLRGVLRQVTA